MVLFSLMGWFVAYVAASKKAKSEEAICLLSAANAAKAMKDYVAAANLYREAAEHGSKDAQYNLGVFHAKGFGVSKNDEPAAKFFMRRLTKAMLRRKASSTIAAATELACPRII